LDFNNNDNTIINNNAHQIVSHDTKFNNVQGYTIVKKIYALKQVK